MRYEILGDMSDQGLEAQVNEAMRKGATLVGGVVMDKYGYVQAVLWPPQPPAPEDDDGTLHREDQ